MNQSSFNLFVSKIYQFVGLNVCFFITNLLFLFSSVALKPSMFTLPIYMITSMPVGIAISSIISCMREEDQMTSSLFKNYFSVFKKRIKIVSKYSILLEICLLVLYVDMLFFSKYTFLRWLNPLSFAIGFFLFSLYTRLLIDLSKKEANYLTAVVEVKKMINSYFRHPVIRSLQTLVLLTGLLVMIMKPNVGFLITPTLFSFIIVKIEKKYNFEAERNIMKS